MSIAVSHDIPDRSGLVSTRYGRLYAVDVGHEHHEPVMLVHGLAVTSHSYRDLAQLLLLPEPFSAQLGDDDNAFVPRRVIVPDLPGSGGSDRPPPAAANDYALAWLGHTLDSLLEQLGVEKVCLAGCGHGAAVAACLAEANPDRVSKLALVGAPVEGMVLSTPRKLALMPAVGGAIFRRLVRREDLRRYLLRSLNAHDILSDRDLDVYWDSLQREGGMDAVYAKLRHLENLAPLMDCYRSLSVPTLLVWGDRDEVCPKSLGKVLADQIDGASLEVIEGCGHAPNQERPAELAARLQAFFSRP